LGQPNFLLQSGSELKSGSIWPQTGLKDNYQAFAASIYPNPVSSIATIGFTLEKSKKITISLYDNLGHKVETITQSQYSVGQNEVKFDATALAKGMYFVQITDGASSSSLKMIVK
ncbi:MAG: T9SS type A sorting domain-containing protein, partial [Bacteroidales bacterium]